MSTPASNTKIVSVLLCREQYATVNVRVPADYSDDDVIDAIGGNKNAVIAMTNHLDDDDWDSEIPYPTGSRLVSSHYFHHEIMDERENEIA